MQVGWQRRTSRHLDGIVPVSKDELASLQLVAHLTACLLSKLKAQGVQARGSTLRFHGIVLCDADELAPLLPTLNTGGLRWVLRVRVDANVANGPLKTLWRATIGWMPGVPRLMGPWLGYFKEPRYTSYFKEPRYTSYFVVKTINGKLIAMDLPLNAFVDDVKEVIANMEGIPPDEQRLIFDGQQLADDWSLMEYSIRAGCVVHLILRLQDGGLQDGGGAAVYASVEVVDTVHKVTFSLTAPRWRSVDEGLNIHGTCLNRACVAYGKEVIWPIGFGPSNVIARDVSCPACYDTIVARTCGFYNCVWRYEGVKCETGLHVASTWKTQPSREAYSVFDDDDVSMFGWRSLILVARARRQARTCALCKCRATYDITRCGHMYLHCVNVWIDNSAIRRVIGAVCPDCHKPVDRLV